MLVSNQSFINSSKITGTSVPQIKEGDTAVLQIKERFGSNEAAGLLKGQEVRVRFDGQVPADERVLVQVGSENEDGSYQVKTASSPAAAGQSETVDSAMVKAGLDPAKNSELKQAAELVRANGGALTKETLQALGAFIENEPGSLNQKLETIAAMQQKKLDLTPAQLKAVHEALHGKGTAEALTELAPGIRFRSAKQQTSDPAARLREAMGSRDYPKAVDKYIRSLEAKGGDPAELAKLKNALLKANQIFLAGAERNGAGDDAGSKLMKIAEGQLDALLGVKTAVPEPEAAGPSKLAEQFQAAAKAVQKEASFPNMVQTVEELLDSDSGLELTSLKEAISKASALMEQGREMAARRELANAFAELEKEHPELQAPRQAALSQAEQYEINQAVQMLGLESKNLIVTEITKKLSQLAIDFKQMKQDVSRNLSQISSMLLANQAKAPIKQTLDAVIAKLDQTILKGDVLLYTDMATEKKLLTASSRLAQARELVHKGSYLEAAAIVKEIKNSIDQILFKPSDVRVKHFVSDQNLLKGLNTEDMLVRQAEMAIKPFPNQEPSARSIYETMRRLGLTHEAEAAQQLIAGKQDQEQMNVKTALMKLMEHEGSTKAEQALAGLTGQQLLSKHDAGSQQSLFMQLPMLLEQQPENVKIYVNGQKEGEAIDWENCSLYFVLETKKLGDIGIMINARDSQLSLTLKNDGAGFEQAMELLAEKTLERLQEIGYRAGAIQFKPFTEPSEVKEADRKPQSAVLSQKAGKKGYDFTI